MELKTWDSVHVDLIGLNSNSIRQEHPVNTIIKKDVSLTFIIMINPDKIF